MYEVKTKIWRSYMRVCTSFMQEPILTYGDSYAPMKLLHIRHIHCQNEIPKFHVYKCDMNNL